MTQQQLIALFKERRRLTRSVFYSAMYTLVLSYLEAQVLYTKAEVEALCRDAYDTGQSNEALNNAHRNSFTAEDYEATEIESWIKKKLTKTV